MTAHFQTIARDQLYLIKTTLEEEIPKNHQVRFFIESIKKLNLKESDFQINHKGHGIHQYPPEMMLTLLLFCYANRVFSSRKIEQATYDYLPVRYITGGLHPDDRTIALFRERNIDLFEKTMLDILKLAKKLNLLSLCEVSLDSSQFKANAATSKNYRIEAAIEEEKYLQGVIDGLLEQAKQADQTPVNATLPEGLLDPKERDAKLKKAVEELKRVQRSREALDQRAKEDKQKITREYDEKVERRKKRIEEGGCKGPELKKPSEELEYDPYWQGNSTDPDSRVLVKLHKRGNAIQGFNVQTIADNDSRLIVTTKVTNNGSDGGQLLPMIEKLESEMGAPTTVMSDQGYTCSAQMQELENRGVNILIPVAREVPYDKHAYRNADQTLPENLAEETSDSDSPNAPPPPGSSASCPVKLKKRRQDKLPKKTKKPKPPEVKDPYLQRKRDEMKQPEMKKRFKRRSSTIEPIFGILKNAMGFRQFLLRGLEKVQAEMDIIASAYNLRRLYVLSQGN